MAYYPSPDPSPATPTAPELPSPRAASPTSATPSTSSASATPAPNPALALGEPPKHKRLTAKTPVRLAEEKAAEGKAAESKDKATVEKIGSKGEVVVVGKRIRCKMCRCVPFYSLIARQTYFSPAFTAESSQDGSTSSSTSQERDNKPLRPIGATWALTDSNKKPGGWTTSTARTVRRQNPPRTLPRRLPHQKHRQLHRLQRQQL